MLVEFTHITMFPIILKQLPWPNGGVAFRRYSARWVATLCRAGTVSSWVQCTLVSNIWCCFSHSQASWVQESRGKNRSSSIQYYPLWPPRKLFASCPLDFRFYLSIVLSSNGRNASTRRYLIGMESIVIPLNWWLRLPPCPFGFLLPLNQQAKK